MLLGLALLLGCGPQKETAEFLATEETGEIEKIEETEEAGEPEETEEIEEYISYSYPKWNLFGTAETVQKDGWVLFERLEAKDGIYALYVPGEPAKLTYFDENGVYLKGDSADAAEGTFLELPANCAYISVALQTDAAENSFLVREDTESENPVFIAAKNETEDRTIQSAVEQIAEEGTVVILPGTYYENVKAWGKKIHFYGADKESCVLESFSASYYAPPLEIGAGSVKNLTIYACKDEEKTSEKYAYGIHVEDNGLYGETLTIENCDIRSDYNSAVGMGMRGGCEVQFMNVHLTGKEWGLFAHDSANSAYSGYQKLTLNDCVVEGLSGSEAMCLDSQGIEGAIVEVTFVNTILKNENAADETTLLVTRNQGGSGGEADWRSLKNYILNEKSAGNNVADMNFVTVHSCRRSSN